MRLNKQIADSGLCSRREADTLILGGQVQVNGQPCLTLGTQIDPKTDTILVNGQPLPSHPPLYLAFYKPKGYLTTRSDDRGRSTLYTLLPPEYQSVDPAGRLDKDSSGLILLSNDGNFLYQITHPKFHLPKVYQVSVNKKLTPQALTQLEKGIFLTPEQKWAKATAIEVTSPTTLQMTLLTGYNRQIRRMLLACGYQVTRLHRTAIGPISLSPLKKGQCRLLNAREQKQLISSSPGSSASI